jgi:hypothetical protein
MTSTPGFTAEMSLYRSNERHHVVAKSADHVGRDEDDSHDVTRIYGGSLVRNDARALPNASETQAGTQPGGACVLRPSLSCTVLRQWPRL